MSLEQVHSCFQLVYLFLLFLYYSEESGNDNMNIPHLGSALGVVVDSSRHDLGHFLSD